MQAHDLPGYALGYRFSDAADYYTAGRFFDLSPYRHSGDQDCVLIGGSPAFDTVNGKRALRLDNSSHWEFLPPMTWEGSIFLILKPFVETTTTRAQFVLFGGDNWGALGANPCVMVSYFSGLRYVRMAFSGIAHDAAGGVNDDVLRFSMFSTSQEARKIYSSEFGVISDSGYISSNEHAGVNFAMCFMPKMLMGALGGLPAGVSPDPSFFVHIYEMHAWTSPILKDNPVEALEFISTKRKEYGLA